MFKRVFFSTVLGLATVVAFGLVILSLDVHPQLNEIEAFDSAQRRPAQRAAIFTADGWPTLGPGDFQCDPKYAESNEEFWQRMGHERECRLREEEYQLRQEDERRRRRDADFELLRSNIKEYWRGGGYFDHVHHWQHANLFMRVIGRSTAHLLLALGNYEAVTLPEEIESNMFFDDHVLFPGIAVIGLLLGLALSVQLTLFFRRHLRNGRWKSDRDGYDPRSDSGADIDYEPPESGTVTQGHREAAGKGWN